MPTFSTRRAALVMCVLIAVLGGMVSRVAYLQTYGRERTINSAERQQHLTEKLVSRRGCIYDANGCLMAGTVQTQTVYVDPKFLLDSYQAASEQAAADAALRIKDPKHAPKLDPTAPVRNLQTMDADIARLARLLDKKPFELSKLVSEKFESRFIKLAENLDQKSVDAILALDIPGIGSLPQNQRYYPMGSIAAHVLGGVGRDDSGLAEKGLEGLELRFNKELAGRDGSQRVLKDARRRAISVAAEDYFPPQHGHHLILTIDSNIQMIAEQELAKTCTEFKADRGECIILDPKTGDVLALSNWPNFNPQILEDSKPAVRRNRALTDPYEPGSTFKPFLAGYALRERVAKVSDVFPLNGKTFVTPYGRKITDVHGYDRLAFWDVLVKSSNIGMCMLAERMGNTKLHAAIKSFQFGQRTGIELPGEDPGMVNPLRKWTKYSTESIAQGYEVMVTPMQLARAFCVYANGGRLVTPRIVRGSLEPDGQIASRAESEGLQLVPSVLDAQTAMDVRRVLADVPVRGTATKARLKDWNIFGKTGTAHVSSGKGGYNDSKYTSSFMCGAPFEDPKIVVVMIIHEPDKALAHYGGTVSAPGASRVVERTLSYLGTPPSRDLPLPPTQVAGILHNYQESAYRLPANVDREKEAKKLATQKPTTGTRRPDPRTVTLPRD
ncbi:MAG TPA: penicillin-binding protein 2 [Tepidisphaeraceae bacterium]|nr:penicillin-binding protein 2 [Tepidisphaeraceae bacterium]